MIRALALGLVLATAFGVAAAASGSGTRSPKPDARDRALLASVLHGMKTNLRSARLERLPKRWDAPNRRESLVLHVVPSATKKWELLDNWYAYLIAGSYNELCGRRADHCVAVEITDGTGGGGIGRTWAHRPYARPQTLARHIRATFASFHLHVTSIAFEHPNAYAPVVTVRTRHPRRAYNAERKAALQIPHRGIAGFYVQMLDAHGHVFFISGGSGNNGEGWCAPWLHCPGL